MWYYFFRMRTITIKVPEELARRLEKRAERLGISKSALVRESVQNALQNEDAEAAQASAYDLMKDGCGCVDSGIGDLSTNPKHMEGFGR
jgi:predicted DNA-binding protein